MKISEIFTSIQGEGLLTGEPTTFIRLQGCEVGCTWCDSKYTWNLKGGKELSIAEIKAQVFEEDVEWICITGGEPLEHLADVEALVSAFSATRYIEIETSGTILLPEDPLFSKITSWVVDLKPPSANVDSWDRVNLLHAFPRLRPCDQIKCVVADEEDLQYVGWVFEELSEHETEAQILISPVFPLGSVPDQVWMQRCAEYAIEHNYRLSLQTHKFIWGDKRGV